MYTLNHKYQSEATLKKWLIEHRFAKEKNCMVQLFSGVIKKDVMQNIADALTKELPLAHIIGTTTDGEINENHVSTYEIVISVSVFESTQLHSVHIPYEDDSFDMGVKIAKGLDKEDVKATVLFTTGLFINGEIFLNGVHSVVHGRYIVAGGMAGDNAAFKVTYVVHNGKVLERGAVGISLIDME